MSMSTSKRHEPELIQVPILEGRVTFLNQSDDVVRSAMRLILSLAIEVEKTEAGVNLQRIERINFNITGARWEMKDCALGVSVYPERPQSAIKIQAGAMHATGLATALLYQEKMKGTIDHTVRQSEDLRVTWFQRST